MQLSCLPYLKTELKTTKTTVVWGQQLNCSCSGCLFFQLPPANFILSAEIWNGWWSGCKHWLKCSGVLWGAALRASRPALAWAGRLPRCCVFTTWFCSPSRWACWEMLLDGDARIVAILNLAVQYECDGEAAWRACIEPEREQVRSPALAFVTHQVCSGVLRLDAQGSLVFNRVWGGRELQKNTQWQQSPLVASQNRSHGSNKPGSTFCSLRLLCLLFGIQP